MPLEAPNLDDRQFADIVEEAVSLIPRFAPEWTDRNDSDPGIALTKLFAWMTELTLFRVNQIPERAYVKFLQMVGIERRPAAAATVELQFTAARQDVAEIWVPEGTSLGGPADEEGPVTFETLAPLAVLGSALTEIQVFDGFSHSAVTTRAAAEGQWLYPFGPRARPGSALMLGFSPTAPMTAGPVDMLFRLAKDIGAARPVAGADPVANNVSQPLAARLVWEYWDLTQWQPLTVIEDRTAAFTRDGHIVLRGPGAAVRAAILGDVAKPLYWFRCRIEEATWERSPRLDAILPNCVSAMQAQSRKDEVLGRSDASPGQRFSLSTRPVLPIVTPLTIVTADGRSVEISSIQLDVDEGSGPVPWQEVDDFFASGPDDPHFVLNRATGVVQFGNSENGRIPLAFVPADGRGNIVARSYLTGGGRRGNLPANSVESVLSYLPGIAGVTNPYSATGGAEEESVGAAKLRAAAEIKSNGRAVTSEDFEVRALETGVRRAKAIPLSHPRYPGVRIPGAVTVIVVPDGDEPNPSPSSATLAAVAAQLDRVRLMTSEIHVAPPRYNLIEVEADLMVSRTADLGKVREQVGASLNSFLHPLTGGHDGLGWPFGGDVFFSDLYRIVLDHPDVLRVVDGQLLIRANGEAQQFCRDVEICAGELVYSTGHTLNLIAEGGR
jgi:Baseplate J-like protein